MRSGNFHGRKREFDLEVEVCVDNFLVPIPFPLPSNHSHFRQRLYRLP